MRLSSWRTTHRSALRRVCSPPTLKKANRVAEDLETGMVWINSTSKSSPDLPFGGVKGSGVGRELARFGFDEFANKKLVRNPKGQQK